MLRDCNRYPRILMRLWARRPSWAGPRCRMRLRCGSGAWNRCAQSDSNCVNPPTFAGATVVTGHSPAETAACGEEGQADLCTDKPPRIPAPRLTTCDRTPPVVLIVRL